jgi:hypothetical protein
VGEGDRHLEHQRRIIAELERDGHNVSNAKALLKSFEGIQAMRIADRDRLREELKNAHRT